MTWCFWTPSWKFVPFLFIFLPFPAPRSPFSSWISMSECRWGPCAHLDNILCLGLKGKLKTSSFKAAREADKAHDGPITMGADMCLSTDDVPVVKWKAENCSIQSRQTVVRNRGCVNAPMCHFYSRRPQRVASIITLRDVECGIINVFQRKLCWWPIKVVLG